MDDLDARFGAADGEPGRHPTFVTRSMALRLPVRLQGGRVIRAGAPVTAGGGVNRVATLWPRSFPARNDEDRRRRRSGLARKRRFECLALFRVVQASIIVFERLRGLDAQRGEDRAFLLEHVRDLLLEDLQI
jgi:hypothetical protein